MNQIQVPKDPENDTKSTWTLKNETRRRIFIESSQGEPGEGLSVAPLASQRLSEEELEKLAYKQWEIKKLISVTKEESRSGEWKTAPFGLIIGVWFWFFIYCAVKVIFFSGNWRTFLWGTLIAVVAMVIWALIAYVPRKSPGLFKRFLQPLAQFLGPFLVLAIGFGLPALIIYFFAGGQEIVDGLAENTSEISDLLGVALQVGYISIASALPALMYFMFQRQPREDARDDFIRDILTLEEDVMTRKEVEAKYETLLNSAFGSSGNLWVHFPIFISTIVITLGWILTLLPIGSNIISQETMFVPNASALNYAFLGAYFFAVNLVFRGYVRADLTAKTYTHIIVRFFVTTILAWVIGSVAELAGTQTWGILAVAFVIGIFPETGLAILQDLMKKVFGFIKVVLKEKHPVTNLEGINLFDQARLLEEGIDNVQNLAYHNLVRLIARTRIPTPRLVDLFDQAILYIHLGQEPEDIKEISSKLRQFGIRTATDLEEVCKNKALLDLIKDEKIPDLSEKLKVIASSIRDEEWMDSLRHWKLASQNQSKSYLLGEFSSISPQ